jgi:transcriptional regulator with XRE-family HTH domain
VVTNNIPNILGYQPKEAREKPRLSLQEVATKASLSKKQVQEIESGGDNLFLYGCNKTNLSKKSHKDIGFK